MSLGSRNGKRVRRKIRAPSERGAKDELDRLLRSYRAGGSTGTLDAYLEEWLRSHRRNVRLSTFTSYEGHVRLHISPLLGGIPLARLSPSDVRRLIDDLERKRLSAATIVRVVTTLRVALNAAVADRAIYDNPARVRLPRVEREPVRAFTFDEAEAIVEAVRGHWLEHIVRLLLGSGIRLGEATGLDQGDLMLDAGFIRLRVTKTQVRAVPITEDAIAALRETLAAAPRRGANEPVFYGVRGRDRMRGDSVTQALPRLMEQAGLGHVTPHDLRHAAATLMLTAGVPMRVISEQLGHRNPALTSRIYAHVIPEQQRLAVAALERRQAR